MGNCLRVFEILRAATSQPTENDDDATLLDPGNYGENLAIPVDESEESDESPLFFRMLNRSNRRRRNNRSRSATYHADTGRITTSNSNSNSRSSRRYHGNRNRSQSVQNAQQQEAGQILLAQRLGLIQHLPLIVWEGKKKNNTSNGDFQLHVESEDQSSPVNSGATNQNITSNDITSENTSDSIQNNQEPPSYEKSSILPTSYNQTTSSSNRNDVLPDSNSSSDKDDTECTICMEDFEVGDNIRYLPCMHFYHQVCIDSWLMRSFTCPRCMEAVDQGIMQSFAQQLS